MGKKTAAHTPALVPQAHGGALLSGGLPGNRGGGRTPDAFKRWCADQLAGPDREAAVEKVLRDSSHPAYSAMWKAVADRAYGRPKESVEHSGSIGAVIEHQPLTILLPPLDGSGTD